MEEGLPMILNKVITKPNNSFERIAQPWCQIEVGAFCYCF